MFLSVDGTFFVQLINFAIFFAILNVVFLRPVRKAIEARRAYIDELHGDYEKAQTQASHLRKSAEDIRAQARRDGAAILAAERAETSDETAALAAEYNAKVQAIVEDAHATVAREVAATQSSRESLVSDLADNIVGKIVPEGAAR